MTWYRIHYRSGKERLVEGEAERDRVMALRRPKAISVSTATVHTCSVCKTEGPWTLTWSWWGSWKQLEDGKPVKKFCSAECRLKWRKDKPKSKNKILGRTDPSPADLLRPRWDAAREAREATGAHRKF